MNLNDDILRGAEAIQAFLGFEKRSQVYHYASKGEIPVFRMGRVLCARKSTLVRFIEQRESEAAKPTLPKTGSDA